jgi:glutamyl-tRNA synthetase
MINSDHTQRPRVRFAPSPTGYFHVGSARSALFNWLFARQHDGTFVLRIEDTDEDRNRPEWTDGIVRALDWLGMGADEGPYLQSEQDEAHQAAIEALWASGAMYACACTRAEIDERASLRAAAGDKTPGYDGHCRDLGHPRDNGNALRFRTPDEGVTVVSDLIRGEVEFPNHAMEDFICVKGNGKPLFVLANVVDDRTMAITHVFRGEEHLPNTPKQMMLWQALNEATGSELALPAFAHLPILVNEQGKKISKRRDPVAVEMYRELGYLPEALRNYLALLGWSPGDEEKVSLQTMIDTFRIENVQKSPAFFDVKKMAHLNGVYIRELPLTAFIDAVRPWVDPRPDEWIPGVWHDPDDAAARDWTPPWPAERFDPLVFARIAPEVQERVAMLGEVPAMVDFLFVDKPVIDEANWQKAVEKDATARQILQAALEAYADCEWSAAALHDITEALGTAIDGRKLGKTQAPIRVAVTGKSVGPPLFESLEVLGREETRRRISAALTRLGPAT